MTEKQSRIIETAALIFAKYGYKKTTIDEIVAAAGISKGLFYHYYPDKKTLYLEMYNTYVDIMDQEICENLDYTETDFLERLKQISHIRISYINKYPNLWGFLYSAYFEQHPDIAPLIQEKNRMLVQNSASGAAANINWSKLKPGIQPDKALLLVTWIAEGFVNKLNADKLVFDDSLYREFDMYLDLLKDGIYEAK